MTDLCARWRGPERRAGQAPALSSMITTSPCGREQRVGQCQAPHERSGAAGCETARGVDTRTPHALCSGRHQSDPKLCAMLRLVSPGPLPGWPLPLQGCGHQARCWAPGSGSCAHRSPAPGATRRFPEGGTARARVHWGAPSGRGMRAPGAQTRGARARGGAGGGPGPGAGNGAAPAARRARGARCRCERAGRARGPERGVQRPAGTGMARRSKSRGAVSRAPRRGLGLGRGGRAGPGAPGCGACVPAAPPLPEAPGFDFSAARILAGRPGDTPRPRRPPLSREAPARV